MQVVLRQSRRAVLPTLSNASLQAFELAQSPRQTQVVVHLASLWQRPGDGQHAAFATKIPKGMTPPVGGKGEVFGSKMIKPSMVSSNILAEPYKGEKAPLPLSSWVTPSGWGLRWGRWKDSWKSMYSLSKLKKNVKAWDLRGFKLEALDMYKETNAALAAGNLSALRSRATPPIYSDMKKQIKQREKAGWAKVEWELVEEPELRNLELVQARVIAADQKDDETAFVQLTVKIPSRQKFTAYDADGKVVAGGGDSVNVVDHWVLELPLSKKARRRYRVAARLQID